jgi:hypothetical protein
MRAASIILILLTVVEIVLGSFSVFVGVTEMRKQDPFFPWFPIMLGVLFWCSAGLCVRFASQERRANEFTNSLEI